MIRISIIALVTGLSLVVLYKNQFEKSLVPIPIRTKDR